MIIDIISGRKRIIFFIQELGFIPCFLPIYYELVKAPEPLSIYISTAYKSNYKDLSVFELNKSSSILLN